MKQLYLATEGDYTFISKIGESINQQLEIHKSDRNTYCKYLWPQLLIGWIENKEKLSKRFRYLQLAGSAVEDI